MSNKKEDWLWEPFKRAKERAEMKKLKHLGLWDGTVMDMKYNPSERVELAKRKFTTK